MFWAGISIALGLIIGLAVIGGMMVSQKKTRRH
jgi:hypothetical protein